MRKLFSCLAVAAIAVTAGCSYKPPFLGTTPLIGYKPPVLTATHLIEDAAQTLENYSIHPRLKAIAEYLPEARGIFIMPKLRDYGIVSGFMIGTGVFVVRTKDGSWSGPSFHALYSTHFTPHLTDRRHSAVIVFRSGPVLDAVIETDGRIDAAPEASIGIVGATNHVPVLHNRDINIVVFTATETAELIRQPFEQASVPADPRLNEGMYGRGATPKAIFHGVVGEPASHHYPATTRRLRQALGP